MQTCHNKILDSTNTLADVATVKAFKNIKYWFSTLASSFDFVHDQTRSGSVTYQYAESI